MKKHPSPRIRPWHNSTFEIKVEVEEDHWAHCQHVWVDLYREVPGRHGRLKVLHATVPLRKRRDEAYRHSTLPSYRLEVFQAANEVLLQAGVPDGQAKGFMSQVAKVYPPPTKRELYDEQINDPLVSMALGKRRRKLSSYRTGKHELTEQDMRLIETCLDDLMERTKTDRALMDRFSKLVLGPRSGADGF